MARNRGEPSESSPSENTPLFEIEEQSETVSSAGFLSRIRGLFNSDTSDSDDVETQPTPEPDPAPPSPGASSSRRRRQRRSTRERGRFGVEAGHLPGQGPIADPGPPGGGDGGSGDDGDDGGGGGDSEVPDDPVDPGPEPDPDPDPQPNLAIFDASIDKTYVEVGDEVTISTTVNNSGDAEGTMTLNYSLGGKEFATNDVTVAANSEKTVTSTGSFTEPQPPNTEIKVDKVTAGEIDIAPAQPDGVNVTGCSGLPSEGSPGGFINMDIEVENTGDIDASTTLYVDIDGEEVTTKDVTIESGTSSESKTVGFSLPNTPGDYPVSAGKRDTGPA